MYAALDSDSIMLSEKVVNKSDNSSIRCFGGICAAAGVNPTRSANMMVTGSNRSGVLYP